MRGYKCIFVMPDKMSQEKIANLRAFGAKVVVCPTAVEPDDPRSYYQVARRIADETPNSFYANQYHNPANPEAHYLSTGPEIWRQTNGEFDVFVAGMGTGRHDQRLRQVLQEKKPDIQIVGVDPVGSLYYDFVKTGRITKPFSYKVEGIGEDFFPTTMNLKIIDEIVRVDDKECFLMTRDLTRLEGLFVGGSGGAAVAGAHQVRAGSCGKPGQKHPGLSCATAGTSTSRRSSTTTGCARTASSRSSRASARCAISSCGKTAAREDRHRDPTPRRCATSSTR